jgi:hypothetical protein
VAAAVPARLAPPSEKAQAGAGGAVGGALGAGGPAAADLLNNRARLIKYFDLSSGRLIFLIDVANRSMIGDYARPVSDRRLDTQPQESAKGRSATQS